MNRIRLNKIEKYGLNITVKRKTFLRMADDVEIVGLASYFEANKLNRSGRSKMPENSRENLDEVMSLVYDELRKYASTALRAERPGHTLQTTALVHEAYVRLAGLKQIDFRKKQDVLQAAIGIMRRILIDFARKRKAKKRDVDQLRLVCPTGKFSEEIEPPSFEILALDEALERLRKMDKSKADIVEYRYFGGRTLEEISELTNLSLATVKRHWTFAKAWLFRELAA